MARWVTGAPPRPAAASPPVRGSRQRLVGPALAAAILAGAVALPALAQPQAPAEIRIGILTRKPPPPAYYEPDPGPEDEAIAGARLGIRDNNTTGAFTGQRYVLEEVSLEAGQDAVAAARALAGHGVAAVALNLPADELLTVADALRGDNVVLFNIGAADDRLRAGECRANLLHVAPSRAMLADALAQFLAFKRWRRLFLVVGPQPADRLYADAVRRAARKFGLQIAAEKAWDFGPLARAKADSPTTAEALVFTRGVDYDVMLVADEAGDFGDYLAYRTWDPRPMAGTQGLTAATWHPRLEVWGAAQAQSRFRRLADRLMRPLDYHAWMAVRAVGDAMTRTRNADPRALRAFLVSGAFDLPAYKGVALSFRPWDQQLRQPILIVQPNALVSVAPEPGFLHQRTPLDSLGIDQPESACRLPAER